jgi:GDP-D-mannose dehydratase
MLSLTRSSFGFGNVLCLLLLRLVVRLIILTLKVAREKRRLSANDESNVLVKIDPRHFRPTEVELLV